MRPDQARWLGLKLRVPFLSVSCNCVFVFARNFRSSEPRRQLERGARRFTVLDKMCIHISGIPESMCAVCRPRPKNQAAARPSAARTPTNPPLEEIIQFLNHKQARATYGAVAGLLGVIPRSMGARLGPHP
jgi:hypothetical protein